jgi:hypothetical protein
MPLVRTPGHIAQTALDEQPRLRLLLAPQVWWCAFLQGAIALCHAKRASFVKVSLAGRNYMDAAQWQITLSQKCLKGLKRVAELIHYPASSTAISVKQSNPALVKERISSSFNLTMRSAGYLSSNRNWTLFLISSRLISALAISIHF